MILAIIFADVRTTIPRALGQTEVYVPGMTRTSAVLTLIFSTATYALLWVLLAPVAFSYAWFLLGASIVVLGFSALVFLASKDDRINGSSKSSFAALFWTLVNVALLYPLIAW